MLPIARVLCSAALGLLLLLAPANAQERMALVIGNSNYQLVPKLKNPANDAHAVAEALNQAGFIVETALDLDEAAMEDTLQRFADRTDGVDIALVYFAGHGIEVGGVNYLIPTDARLRRDRDVEFEAVPLSKVLRAGEQARLLRVVILDACRDNPFLTRMQRSSGLTRSVTRGLARVEPELDTIVALSSRAGEVADDGTGLHSPYTQALLKHIGTPGLDVRFLFGRVRDDVKAATSARQQPVTYGELGGAQLVLVPDGGAPQSPPIVAPPTVTAPLDGPPASAPTGGADVPAEPLLPTGPDVQTTIFGKDAAPPPTNAERGWLGVNIHDITQEIADALGLEKVGGAIVVAVIQNSPADRAGLKAQDVILTINGRPVGKASDLAQQVAEIPIGQEVDVELVRDGQRSVVQVTIGRLDPSQAPQPAQQSGDVPSEFSPLLEALAAVDPKTADQQVSLLGMDLAVLDDTLRDQFKLDKVDTGVVVVSVADSGTAQQVGLAAGDLILEANATAVTQPEVVKRQVEELKSQGKKAILLLVRMSGERRYVAMKIGAP